ncbi:MAG: DNA cytosine methyltransferase [Bacilli bacterium]|nr:DNA cytosine methyltransferase [Bacilli bacterium]
MGRFNDIEKLKNIRGGVHPCKLNKVGNGEFLGVEEHSICEIDCETASAVCARYYKGIAAHRDNIVLEAETGNKKMDNGNCEVIGKMDNSDGSLEIANRVYGKQGVSPCLNAHAGDTVPKIIGDETKERFFRQAEETFLKNDCKPGDTINAYNRTVDQSGTSPTITTRPEGFKTAILPVVEKENNEMAEEKKTVYRIRKLTPKECFRLMDVTDEDADKMLSVNSNSQCYKQAGNSIVVACLIALFSQLNICQNGIQLKTWNEGLYKELGYDKDEVGGGSSITV